MTLVEVMVALTLGSLILAGVLTSTMQLGRSGFSVASYSMMDAESRKALEIFGQDVRMARSVTWNSAQSVTLTIPDAYSSTTYQVTYAWDSATSGSTARTFYVKPGNASSSSTPTILIRSVEAFSYSRYDRLDQVPNNSSSIKRIRLAMTIQRSARTVADTTRQVVSASYILRNKTAN